MLRYPVVVFLLSVVTLWLAGCVGTVLRKRRPLEDDEREDFGFLQAGSLTLLGLIIGFTFSMAIARYDQRKTYEEAEANAIGTEYVRASLMPADVAARVRELLSKYLDLRIAFYTIKNYDELQLINNDTSRLQTEMWSSVQAPAVAQPTPLMALVVAGMNDVLNSQGYAQAGWLNRIPVGAWMLMIAIAVGCNMSVGYGRRSSKITSGLLFILPLFVSVALFLIADIDSPRRGLIRVSPENLISLQQSLPK
jgi:hypothetical protein